MPYVELLLDFVKLSGLSLGWQDEFGKTAEKGEEVDQCSGSGLIDDCEFTKAFEELFELGVIFGWGSPAAFVLVCLRVQRKGDKPKCH